MERYSCCWSRCPRQRRTRKTLVPPFFPPFSLPPVPPIGHIQLKTCWSGRLRKAACRSQHPANTEHSRKEWRTYLRAKCPGDTRPLDILRTSIAPCFITHNLSFYFGHPFMPHGSPISFRLLCTLKVFSKLSFSLELNHDSHWAKNLSFILSFNRDIVNGNSINNNLAPLYVFYTY